MARGVGALLSEAEELAGFVLFDQRNLIKEPPLPGPLIERCRRDTHVVVDPSDINAWLDAQALH